MEIHGDSIFWFLTSAVTKLMFQLWIGEMTSESLLSKLIARPRIVLHWVPNQWESFCNKRNLGSYSKSSPRKLISISHLGKRKNSSSQVPWEGGYAAMFVPRKGASMHSGHPYNKVMLSSPVPPLHRVVPSELCVKRRLGVATLILWRSWQL